MEQNRNSQINKVHPLIFISIGVTLFLVAVVLIFTRKVTTSQITDNSEVKQQTISPITKPNIERFGKLDISTPATSVVSGQDVTVVISGDSIGKEIVGYDVLVSYDKSALTLQSAKSNITDFSIFKFDRSTHLSLTAVKNLNSKTPTILKGIPMVGLVFKTEKSGTFPVVIQPAIDKESTKMVDEKTNVFYPNLSSVTINVK